MTALLDKIAELKTEQQVISNLINRVNTLENMPDETKHQLAEYVRNFDITDGQLKQLNNDQLTFHRDCIRYLQQFGKTLANKQVVIDQEVINDIKNLVEAQTGFNLRDYVTNVQHQLITKSFSNLTNMQSQLINKLDTALKRQDTINNNLNNLENRISGYINEIIICFGIIGSIAFLLTIPSYISSFSTHPVLTTGLIIVTLTLNLFLLYKAYQQGDHDNNGY